VEIRDFESELQRLERQHLSGRSNPGSFECHGCELCAACMFSSGCVGCYRSTHCRDCRSCTHCSHSASCESCHGCAYCHDCRACTGSAYLVRSVSCSDCTYCFGCVGLVKKEFHILNLPYTRQDYFEIVKRLSAELRLPPLP
jgi:hypothetical protein